MLFDLLYESLDRFRRPLQNHHYVVLPRLGIAYARVPKVANSSIKRVLARQIDFRPPAGMSINQDQFWQHKDNRAAELLTAGELKSRYPAVFVFSFVRNPFDRIISCYANKIVKNAELTPSFRRLGFGKGMSFAAFLARIAEIDDRAADNHFRSQADILTHRGRLVPDFIGRLDRVDTDWAKLIGEVKKRSGVDLGPMEERHVTRPDRGSDLADYFDSPVAIEMVRKRYRDDFTLFFPEAADPGAAVAD